MSGEGDSGTFGEQASLPALPLPELESTVSKMVASAAVFQSEEEQEHTAALARDFVRGVGARLQEVLSERAAGERNWLEEWWERFIYLMPRPPIAALVNWWGVLPGSWGKYSVSQSQAAGLLAHHLLLFRDDLLQGKFPVERMAGQPLCMHQFSRAFNCCRVPGEGEDELRIDPLEREGKRHVVVLCGGEVYAFQALDAAFRPLPANVLAAQFQRVLDMSSEPFARASESHVALLTSEERDTWARARHHLQSLSEENAANLETIESALFSIVLERGTEPDLEKRARVNLCGRGGRNRWFDRPFNLILYEDATGGINGEHSWADAMVIVSIFDRLIDTLDTDLKAHGMPALAPLDATTPLPTKLRWELDASLRQAIELASAHVARLIARVDLRVLDFEHFGKNLLKRYRLVPDSFVQVAIQLAFWRMHRRVVATYESAHTRLFFHGRTETIRTTCKETVEFCKAMDRFGAGSEAVPEVSAFSAAPKAAKEEDGEEEEGGGEGGGGEGGGGSGGGGSGGSGEVGRLVEMLQAALKSHRKRGKDALLGQGIDRHLFGLYVAAELLGEHPRPALFTDPGIIKSRTYVLSTSNISMQESAMIGGFFPITKDGYGVCYGIQGHKIQFSICADAADPTTCATKFKETLTQALIDLQELVCSRDAIYTASKL